MCTDSVRGRQRADRVRRQGSVVPGGGKGGSARRQPLRPAFFTRYMCSMTGVGAVAPKVLYRGGVNKCYGVAVTRCRIMFLHQVTEGLDIFAVTFPRTR